MQIGHDPEKAQKQILLAGLQSSSPHSIPVEVPNHSINTIMIANTSTTDTTPPKTIVVTTPVVTTAPIATITAPITTTPVIVDADAVAAPVVATVPVGIASVAAAPSPVATVAAPAAASSTITTVPNPPNVIDVTGTTTAIDTSDAIDTTNTTVDATNTTTAVPKPFSGLRVVAPHMGGPIHSSTINVNDVLCGRGTAHRTHSGNRRYHMLVKHFEPEYSKATCKDDKTKISRAIVAAVRNAKWAGRFLQKCEQVEMIWFELGDRKAWEKTSQLLREYVSMGQHRTAYQSRKYRKDGVEIMGLDESLPGSPEEGSGVNQILIDCLRTTSVPESPQSPVIQSLQNQQQANQQAHAQAQQQGQQQAQQQAQQQQQARPAQQQRQQQDNSANNPLQTSVYNVSTSVTKKSQYHQASTGSSNNAAATKNTTTPTPARQAQPPPPKEINLSHGSSITTPNITKNFSLSSSITTPNITKNFPVPMMLTTTTPAPTTTISKSTNKRPFISTVAASNNDSTSKSNKNAKNIHSTITMTAEDRVRGGTPVYLEPLKQKKVRKPQPVPMPKNVSRMVKQADMDLITVRKGTFFESLRKEIGLWSFEPSGDVMRQLVDISRKYHAQVSVYSQMEASDDSDKGNPDILQL